MVEDSAKVSQDIFHLINKVRKDPKSIVSQLKEMEAKFEGDLLKREGKPNLRTKEGAKAVQEAIKFVEGQSPLPDLVWEECLAQAAKDHCLDIGPLGQMTHDSSDGRGPKDRFKKYGKFFSSYGENLSFACDNAQEIVLQLIIDDGVLERGHRENIFNSAFRVMGCHFAPHKHYEYMACLDLAEGFVKEGEEDPIEKQMDEFLKQEVEFNDMPEDVVSWKQNAKVSVHGNHAKKTVTRVCKMKNGEEKSLEITVEKDFTV